MTRLAYILLVSGVGWLFYVYAGYPLCLWALTLLRRIRHVTDESYLPTVSVIIAARNEQKDIGWKVRQTLAWDYPRDRLQVLVGSDASDDATDEIVRSIPDSRVKLIRINHRGGKVRVLNHLARLADGELLFFTDANSDIASGALRRIVRHFSDSRVGCVTGADQTAPVSKTSAIGAGEQTYWNYELTIDELESRLGSVLVCFGAIHCIRRALYFECDPDLANDLETPIRIGDRGKWILFEPDAVSLERATTSVAEEFKRRRRICGQGALASFRLYSSIKGMRAWQFFSRKFLRWLAVVPLSTILIATIILARDSGLAFAFLLCQLSCYAAAVLGWHVVSQGRNPNRLFAIPLYYVLVNAAAFLGLIDACRGRRYATWHVATLTRGIEALPKIPAQSSESDRGVMAKVG